MVFFFPFLTSFSMRISSCIHVAANGMVSFFFYGCVVFHCVHVPHLLNPLIGFQLILLLYLSSLLLSQILKLSCVLWFKSASFQLLLLFPPPPPPSFPLLHPPLLLLRSAYRYYYTYRCVYTSMYILDFNLSCLLIYLCFKYFSNLVLQNCLKATNLLS